MPTRRSQTAAPPSNQLRAWLKTQATRLKTLKAHGWKLQVDYLQNAKEQGAVLLEVQKRLEGTTLTFSEWVKADTEIGLSTAYLWMDVAKWWDDILEWITKAQAGDHSNPLETSIRAARNVIQAIRQARGIGKPGSGKTNAQSSKTDSHKATPSGSEIEVNDLPDDEAAPSIDPSGSPGDADDEDDNDSDTSFMELMARKPPAVTSPQGETRSPARPRFYKVTVVTPNKADLQQFAGLLPSPTTDFKAHSVSANIGLQDIDRTLAAVGTCLNTAQPKKVRVVVEL